METEKKPASVLSQYRITISQTHGEQLFPTIFIQAMLVLIL